MIRPAIGLVLSIGVASSLTGQSPDTMQVRGLTAYRALDYERAVLFLRAALVAPGSAVWVDTSRATTLLYLGASHLFGGRADSAAAAFRGALAADPRAHLDTLIFPPRVSEAFLRARAATAYVRIRMPSDTTVPADGRVPIRIYASWPSTAQVDLINDAGEKVRRLYSGPVADSLDIDWDGRDTAEGTPRHGPTG